MTSKVLRYAAIGATAATIALGALPALAGNPEGNDKPEVRGALLSINHRGHVVVNHAEVASVGSSSLVIKIWGTNWTVQVTDETKFTRRAGGKATLSAFAAGDFVHVRGTVADGRLEINATRLHNQSIREAKISGTITAITAPDMLTVSSTDRIQAVKVASDAKIMMEDETNTFADLAVGMKVSVKGFMNRVTTILTATKIQILP